MNEENRRLKDKTSVDLWKQWGPYLTERQWGTVREDYSPDGTAWEHISHDMSRSFAYRWGEDGIGGICDDKQQLCFALAFWNYKDPIIKERLFGLTGNEGNHGEDVKEFYYYLDSTPTHSYMKMLYKYPQSEFPYSYLVKENTRRGKDSPEFELVETGAFDEDRYFDINIEYGKADYNDILIRITAHNRGPEQAMLDIIPQLWFRNTWSWKDKAIKPLLEVSTPQSISAKHSYLGDYTIHFCNSPELLFCENETNGHKLYNLEDTRGFYKDGISEYIVNADKSAVNGLNKGTKVGLRYSLKIASKDSSVIELRLTNKQFKTPFKSFNRQFSKTRAEADEFYQDLQKNIDDEDLRLIQRQALAGLLWSKQFYYYDIPKWLDGDLNHSAPPSKRLNGRNSDWVHLNNADIISMPDKWEYPWYAAWDLAFHCLPIAMVDTEFAKEQLTLMTREWYMHPNGQLPAYEWAFGDVNPPVHAWASWRIYQIDRKQTGTKDVCFLEGILHKLLMNFTWWVNRKDADGRNLFQGGFLGLDNIGVFDRSATLPTGGHVNQSDGTSWMAMYSLNLMRISLELAAQNPVYQDIATKFFEHFLYIAEAMTNVAGEGLGLWDEEDQFYYDVLNLPDGQKIPLKVRSIVGLIPLFAVEIIEPETLENLPEFGRRLEWYLKYKPHLASLVSRWNEPGRGNRRLLSLLRGSRLKKLLKRMLDESEFFSSFGIRALSKVHKDEPYVFNFDGNPMTVGYQPAESDTTMFGGNSNWRGPIWFPVNYLIIESLQKFHHYYGDDFKVECPTGSGKFMTLLEVAEEISRRLVRIFIKDKHGKRPVLAQYKKACEDPHFKDNVLFYEYFHGDSGRGVGASHQTGWTGLVAKLIHPREGQSKTQDQFVHQCEE